MGCDPNYRHADFAYYRYAPSVGLNIAFTVLFSITTAIHVIQIWKTRTWYLSALVVGGICEVVGYTGRILSSLEDVGCWSMGTYIMQSLAILLAPAFMAASIYMILGRIILLTDSERYALIKQRWLTKVFVTGDVLSFILQGSGGGLMASGSTQDLGQWVVVGGLFVQLFFFGFFIIVAVVFHTRMRRNPTHNALTVAPRWPIYLMTLYVTGALIWVRSLFRVVEFIEGNDGALMKSEVYVFVFDGLLMVTALIWMNWFHPSEIGILMHGKHPVENGFRLLNIR